MASETGKEDKYPPLEERWSPICWCWPGRPTPYWAAAFGGILVVVGGIWLLTTLQLLPKLIENALGPMILILIGLASLVNSVVMRR